MTLKNLIISGGGIYGIMMIGVINNLDKYDLLKNIKRYLGTSVGAIICLLLNINYNSTELEDFVYNFNFNLLIQNNSLNKLNIFDNLMLNYGLNNTKNMKYILDNLLEFKNLNKNITFKELYLHSNKELNINCSCVNTSEVVIFNHINNPDNKVVDIIVTSCSIPILFTPTIINEKYYVDGGLYNNIMAEYFENELDDTILITTENFGNFNFNNFENYFLNLLISKFEYNNILSKKFNIKNVIECKQISNIHFWNFKLEKDDKVKLFELGQKYCIEFIKNKYYYKYFFKKNLTNLNIYE